MQGISRGWARATLLLVRLTLSRHLHKHQAGEGTGYGSAPDLGYYLYPQKSAEIPIRQQILGISAINRKSPGKTADVFTSADIMLKERFSWFSTFLELFSPNPLDFSPITPPRQKLGALSRGNSFMITRIRGKLVKTIHCRNSGADALVQNV